jgi:2-polyprenyl-3-methyl-5-hydroxy-6-metoxy-1,4-benzoquinol methylase
MRVQEPIRRWEGKGRRLALRLARRHKNRLARLTSSFPILANVTSSLSDVQTLSTLAELDDKLREVDTAFAVSDDKMREVFQTFKMASLTDLPDDPYSPKYAERQFELYRVISGRKTYEIENERSDFPVDPNRPFPYYTESPETVGNQLMAIGIIIRTMALSAGSSILELGPGWGNTTVALARMGYDVTAVDIDPTFVDLIRARADKLSLSIDVRRGGFLEVDQMGRTFDAILFFECFHHCSDHRELIRKLAVALVPEGRVYFAAEPIDDSFPMPWGLRLDGESLWAIRRNGWFETGFQESYFIRMLHHLGWSVKKHVTPATHLGVIFEAWRANGTYPMSTFHMPPDEDATWAAPDSDGRIKQRYSSRRSVISLERKRECGWVVIDAVSPCPRQVSYKVRHGRHTVSGVAEPRHELAIRVPYDPMAEQLVVEADTWRPYDLLGSADTREIGLDIRSISLEDEG